MAKISLSGGFAPMAEGVHIFKITEATYDEDFGKITCVLTNKAGQKHWERFSLIGKDGNVNDKAASAFASFAKAALGNADADEVDVDDMVGLYIKGDIAYYEYTKKDGTTGRSTQKAQGTWWQTVSPEEIAAYEGTAPAPAKPARPSLSSILG